MDLKITCKQFVLELGTGHNSSSEQGELDVEAGTLLISRDTETAGQEQDIAFLTSKEERICVNTANP